VNDVETRRIFLADRLENGAGYAPEIGNPVNLKGVIDRILDELDRAVGHRHVHATGVLRTG